MLSSVARPARAWALVTAGWLAVWLVFTGVALTGDAALHKLVATSDWLRTRNAFLFLAAVALVVAGLAQFIPVTRRRLTACRDPEAFLIQHFRRGLDGAWTFGVRQASCCLGWCWPYFLVIFVQGTGALGWMAVVTTLMLAETCARRGPQLVVPVGIALLAIGTWLGLSEWLTPGFADISVPSQGHQH
jgi:predicted metal-binding membrane protein